MKIRAFQRWADAAFFLCFGFFLVAQNAVGADFIPEAKNFMTELTQATKKTDDKTSLHAVSSHVDFESLAKKSLGKRWQNYSPSERKSFLETLQDLLELIAYPQAKKISVKPENIDYSKVPGSSNKVQATGQIDREKKGEIVSEKVEVIFIFDPSSHKIVDAVIEGEQLSTNLKRQFDEALKKESFDKIIEQMKKRRDEAKKPSA